MRETTAEQLMKELQEEMKQAWGKLKDSAEITRISAFG